MSLSLHHTTRTSQIHRPTSTGCSGAGALHAPQLDTLIEPYQDYLHSLNRRASGVRRYSDQVRAFVTFLGPHAEAAQMTTRAITSYRVEMARRRCNGGTIGNALTAIRSFSRWLIQEGILDHDPTLTVEWPQRDDPIVRSLSKEELRQLFVAITEPEGLDAAQQFIWRRNRRVIYLMLYAGLRISEASALLWRDVYLDDRVLVVQQGKGGRRRELPIHAALEAELSSVPHRRRAWPVAGTSENQPLSPKSMAHIFERWLAGMGVDMSAHMLRRTFATQLLRHGATLRDIQQLLGHRSLKTTAAYLGVDPQNLEEGLSKLPSSW